MITVDKCEAEVRKRIYFLPKYRREELEVGGRVKGARFPEQQSRNPCRKKLTKRHFVCRAYVHVSLHACGGRGHQ